MRRRDSFRTTSILLVLATALLGAVALATSAHARQARSARIASYDIDVFLDPGDRTLVGRETITWRNPTEHDADELRFHLYYNAWRNDRSSFLTHYRSRDAIDTREYGPEDWAWCDVEEIRLEPGLGDESEGGAGDTEAGRRPVDLTGAMRFESPNDGNSHDRTVLVVPVDPPVAPGETVRIAVRWESRIPRTFRRTGVRGDFYFLAQWFPKIAVFEADGTWNAHQFMGTEFFANFGNYDVRIEVPDDWVVGATGKRVELTKGESGTATHRFVQEDVHDFTWTAAPDTIVYEQDFEAADLPAVRMRLLLRPDHKNKKQRYFDATATTLEKYGSWFGPYPYDHVTIVDPAFRSGAGGMEYPTLFTGGTRWLAPKATLSPEGVTVHETGHQWWYGVVANNEFEHAWLDEGLNTYSDRLVREEAYPRVRMSRRFFDGVLPIVFHELPGSFRLDGADRYCGRRSVLLRDSMATPSLELGPGSYGRMSYDKPALMLRTLERTLGRDTLLAAMRTYFERFAFEHPEPEDFFETVEEVSGEDLTEFWDAVYYGSGTFDYAVEDVRSRHATRVRGLLDDADVPVGEDGSGEDGGGEPRFVEKKVDEPNERFPAAYDTSVIVRRWGDAIFPVDVRFTFADGDVIDERWDGRDRWKRYDFRRPAEIVRVEVDPERKLALDIDTVNNTWVKHTPARAASLKWASRWTLWLQNLLEQMAFFS